VVGGLERGPFGEVLGPAMTAEVWDPTTTTFSDAGTADGPYAIPTATLLADGRVLVLGGGPERTSALIWDPATGTFEPTGSLHEGRAGGQTATLLPDGSVLIIGGSHVTIDAQANVDFTALASVEVWDPETGEFHEAPPMPEGRYDHTATLLPDGRIVVTGGMVATPTDPLRQEPTGSLLVRDGVSGVFHSGGAMAVPRSNHAADRLPDGRLLVIGGADVPAASTAEAWDPVSGTTSPLAPPSTRQVGVATHLPDGTLLLSGGWQPPASPDSDGQPPTVLDLEVYDPTP
jgi:WD40 repeat protein